MVEGREVGMRNQRPRNELRAVCLLKGTSKRKRREKKKENKKKEGKKERKKKKENKSDLIARR